MRWWPFSDKENSRSLDEARTPKTANIGPMASNYSKGQKILLEDIDPRFDSETSQRQMAHSQEEANLKKALDSIKVEDFSFAKLSMIPCFRDAGLIGFTSMFVSGTVTFLYHKNPLRSANWSVAGLLLGSVVGWEQCRLKRKRSFQVGQMARDTIASKKRPMLNSVKHEEKLVQQWEGHKNGERLVEAVSEKKSPWYKFW